MTTETNETEAVKAKLTRKPVKNSLFTSTTK
jgi:hypothetical protein